MLNALLYEKYKLYKDWCYLIENFVLLQKSGPHFLKCMLLQERHTQEVIIKGLN
jgi:hypothetical protein